MIQKLEEVEKRYEELNKLISDPEVISNTNEWKKLMKEHSDLEDVVLKYREYKKMKNLYHPKHDQELIKRDAAHHQHHHARHKHHLNHYYD